MNMQPTGVCHVAAIPQGNCPPAELRPRHVVQMIVQAHRMRHDLKAIAEGTIMLDVNMQASRE